MLLHELWIGPNPCSYSRTSLMFFVVAFLTFMAIAGFPAFVEDMAVFMRERMNGWVYVEVSVGHAGVDERVGVEGNLGHVGADEGHAGMEDGVGCKRRFFTARHC